MSSFLGKLLGADIVNLFGECVVAACLLTF